MITGNEGSLGARVGDGIHLAFSSVSTSPEDGFMDDSNHKRFVSTQQLGQLLGVTRQTIRNWCVKGEIQAFKIGQNLKIPRTEAIRVLRFYHLSVPAWLCVGEKPRDEDNSKPAGHRPDSPSQY
jgi:excisionase family DNA binding protein